MTNYANIWHFYGSADFIYVFWFNKYGGERKKKDIGEKFGAESGRKNPKDKMRQYEKNQVKQNGKIFNNTFQKSLHPEVTSLPVSRHRSRSSYR
jgi:hypothetical protein